VEQAVLQAEELYEVRYAAQEVGYRTVPTGRPAAERYISKPAYVEGKRET